LSKSVSVKISDDTKNFYCTCPKEKIIETNPLIIISKLLGCRRNDYWKKAASLKYNKITLKMYLVIISVSINIQQDATIPQFILSVYCSGGFGWFVHPKHAEQYTDIINCV